jgi:glycosyltransferase involved in cell wall biosynthesis
LNVLILNGGKGWGGIESHCVTLASALIKKGHKVIIGCPREGTVSGNAARADIPVRDINVVNSADLKALWRIVATAKREGIEIIVANLGKEYWPAAVAAKVLGIRIVFVRHQVDRLKKATRYLIERHVQRVAAVSIAVRDALTECGVSDEKITVIYNAVDIGWFKPSNAHRESAREELGFAERDIVVGTAGKLHRGKGVYDLLQAAGGLTGRYRALRLLYVGDGPERTALEQEAIRLSIRDKVVFAGLRSDMERMYAAMDIFVLPSTCREAFGMVIIEAMAMGKPVIATATGGIPEVVKDGTNGILVHPGDLEGLADAICRLIDDGALSSRLSGEGRATVEQYYSEDAISAAFENMLREVLATA